MDMEIKYNTTREAIDALCEKIANKQATRQDFEELVDTAKKCAVFNDDGRYVKFLLPFKNDFAENLFCYNLKGMPWSEGLAQKVASLIIEVLSKITPVAGFFSYYIEKKDNGYYLAFDVENSEYAGARRAYFLAGDAVVSGFKKQGINITPEEWLERFPIEYYTSSINRDRVTDYMVMITRRLSDSRYTPECLENLMNEEERSMVADAIFFNPSNYRFTGLIAGRDIDLSKYPTGYISNWKPSESFIETPRFEYLDIVKDFKDRGVRTEDELMSLKVKFINKFNKD